MPCQRTFSSFDPVKDHDNLSVMWPGLIVNVTVFVCPPFLCVDLSLLPPIA